VNRVVLIIIAVVSLLQEAGAVTLRWSTVDTAVDGTSIPALVIVYRVYWSLDDADWNYATETDEVFLNLDSITSGCYFLHVTAVRTDSDVESVPSQSLQYCYGDIVGPGVVPSPAAPEEVYVQ
jgi:hypothetical protein